MVATGISLFNEDNVRDFAIITKRTEYQTIESVDIIWQAMASLTLDKWIINNGFMHLMWPTI